MEKNVKQLEKPAKIFKREITKPKNPIWSVPKMWLGETVFILGGGPTLNDINLDLIKHRKVIGINNAYGDPNGDGYIPRDWVDICFFADQRWRQWHSKDIQKFKGMVVTCRSTLHGKSGMFGLHRGQAEGLEERPQFLAWNKSSGGAAINLAYHLGATTCVLLGYDMRRVGNRANWHHDHPAPQKNPYERFLLPYAKVAKDADRLGMKIINCTLESALRVFPIMSLERFLESEIIMEGAANV